MVSTDVFGDTKNNNNSLSNSLYVPDLRTNLVSVSKITNNNLEVVFKKDSALVYDVEGNIKLVADHVSDHYYVRECKNQNYGLSSSEARDNFKIWHSGLGHLNQKDLLECVKKGVIQGVEFGPIDTNFKLDVCVQGK